MTLALLLTAVTGAWAAEVTVTFTQADLNGYSTVAKDGVTLTPGNDQVHNRENLYNYGSTTFSVDKGTFTKIEIVCTYVNPDISGWQKIQTGSIQPDPYDPEYLEPIYTLTWTGEAESVAFTANVYGIQSITFTIADPNAIDVTTNAASEQDLFTEASFTMPTSDVTVNYELVRDMTIAVSAEMPSRVRIQKDNNVFVAVTPSEMLPTVTDGIDEQNPATMTSATDYTLQLQKEGENNSWTDVTELSVGTFRYAVTGVGLYDGVMYTNTFELFQGYEIDVPAGEYVTYYKDENLYEEDPDVKLYTISSVSTTAATLSSEIAIAPANTPILVYNGGQEAKTVLLIPTVDAADNVQAATAFKGTLTETTIPASTSTMSNYALNGKQFVWVKEALPVAANKCWLEIPNSANAAPAMTIVFGEATGIGVIDNGQRTSGDWYDLNGRKLQGRPTKKGVYINNGRKVVIK